MTMLVGQFSLALAVIAAAVGIVGAMWGLVLKGRTGLRLARWSIAGLFVALTVASIALLVGFVSNDFSINYVWRYGEKALPFGYKVAGFWAGQEGSLLLWAWFIVAMGGLWVLTSLKKRDADESVASGTVALVCGFFAAVILFAANPFDPNIEIQKDGTRMVVVPDDGRGLNPQLQDPAMVAHPPFLFLGYAGFTIPFAMMIGALVVNRKDSQWLAVARRWLVMSWLFLTIGIVLGAQWAYVELGWGGYWAWDPVENASLLPWFTATAVLHSLMVHQQRGMLKRGTLGLIAITFILCIFGTWITRSGVVSSVHGFGASTIGNLFLGFLILNILLSIVLIAVRFADLRGEHPIESVWGKETAFLATNVLMIVMMLVTMVGTLLPAITGLLTGNKIEVKQPFYNSVVVPMGLLLMAMMAFGPLLSFGKSAGLSLAKRIAVPLIGGVALAAVVVAKVPAVPDSPLASFWAAAVALIIGVAVVSVLGDLVVTIIARIKGGENPLLAVVRVIDGNHRRYGGQAIHVGMLMVMAGLAGSSLYKQDTVFGLQIGEKRDAGGWTLALNDLREVEEPTFNGVEAVVQVTSPDGESRELGTQKRHYPKWREMANTEVGIWSTASKDVYLALKAIEVKRCEPQSAADVATMAAIVDSRVGLLRLAYDIPVGALSDPSVVRMVPRRHDVYTAHVQMLINPLVCWIWIGAIVMTAGGLFCVLPRLLPAGEAEKAAEAAAAAAVATPVEEVPPARSKRKSRRSRYSGPIASAR